MTITLFCPSRGRPAAARELLDSFLATKVTDARLVFCLDNDDSTIGDYPPLGPVAYYSVGPPSGDPVTPLNHAASNDKSDIVGFIGDDSRCETPGWDARVERALQEPGVYWGWDGHDIPWPSTYFVSKSIVDALGYLALPTLKRGFFDTVWVELGRMTGCARIDEQVMFRHNNDVHEQPDPKVILEDQRKYNDWVRTQSGSDIRKVKTVTDLARFFA